MPVFDIDPQKDPRWMSFVESHPRSSVFHTKEWLEALRRTYQYRPTVFTTSPAEAPLTNGIVFCEVKSWLTGHKLVSLPFSDHCEPLVEDPEEFAALLSGVARQASGKLKYAEIRPRWAAPQRESAWAQAGSHHFHAVDLRPALEELQSRLHKDGVQRKIRRADREGVSLHQGRSDSLLHEFYDLMLITRRRHGLPPQPLRWFRNLMDCLGPRLTIRVARFNGKPIASILTLRHKNSLVYKYGCSDDGFHNLGAMPRLFWETICDAKSEQIVEFDLGRSDENNPGLVRFKDHLGATKTSINYWRFPEQQSVTRAKLTGALQSRLGQKFLLSLPDGLFRLAGEFFYRHAG